MSEPRSVDAAAARTVGGTHGSIVVLGEALVDLVISPAGSVEAALGGAPFNTARTAARLGADVAFVGALSDDRFGTMLRTRLVGDGVDVDSAVPVELPTTLAAAELDDDGAASYRFYIDGTSAPAVTHVAPPTGREAVVFTGGLGLVLEPLAEAVTGFVTDVARRPAGERPLVMVDVNCRPLVVADRDRYLDRVDRVVAHADVVKVSDDDLAYLSPGVDPVEAAQALLERGPEVVLLTAGGRDVTIAVAGGVRTVPVAPVEVVDTIGAGDAFGGGFCAWWTLTGRGRDDLIRSAADASVGAIDRTVVAANVVAAAVCGRQGADPPWRHELAADWSS